MNIAVQLKMATIISNEWVGKSFSLGNELLTFSMKGKAELVLICIKNSLNILLSNSSRGQ